VSFPPRPGGRYIPRDITQNARAVVISPDPSVRKRSELKAFLFLTVVMAPVLAVIVVGTYGLAVWIYQLIAGPPTG